MSFCYDKGGKFVASSLQSEADRLSAQRQISVG